MAWENGLTAENSILARPPRLSDESAGQSRKARMRVGSQRRLGSVEEASANLANAAGGKK